MRDAPSSSALLQPRNEKRPVHSPLVSRPASKRFSADELGVNKSKSGDMLRGMASTSVTGTSGATGTSGNSEKKAQYLVNVKNALLADDYKKFQDALRDYKRQAEPKDVSGLAGKLRGVFKVYPGKPARPACKVLFIEFGMFMRDEFKYLFKQ
jgi:hypothetical protein